jgi:hypothetical protein
MSNKHVKVDRGVDMFMPSESVRRAIAGSKEVATGGEVLDVRGKRKRTIR